MTRSTALFTSALATFILLSGPALAASLTFRHYEIEPHHQRVLITTQVSLGYPVGDTYAGLILDCRANTATVLNLGTSDMTESFEGEDTRADPALTKALATTGLVSSRPGVLSVKVTGQGTLTSRCQNGVLDAALLSEPHGDLRVYSEPIVGADLSQRPYDTAVSNLDFSATPVKGGYRLGDFGTSGPLSLADPKVQVLVSDGKALYPIHFAGQDQRNTSASSLTVSSQVLAYLTMDGATWTRTTFNLATGRVQTTAVPKPSLPVRP